MQKPIDHEVVKLCISINEMFCTLSRFAKESKEQLKAKCNLRPLKWFLRVLMNNPDTAVLFNAHD